MKRRWDTDNAAAQEEAEQARMAEQMATDAAEAEKAEVRAAFESIDLDGNGTLERDELEQAAERLGQHMSPAALDAAMAEIREVVERHGASVETIDHPTSTLEELFLRTVEESRERPGRRFVPEDAPASDEEPAANESE